MTKKLIAKEFNVPESNVAKLDFYKIPDADFQEDMSHRIMNKSDRFEDIALFKITPSATGYPIKNYKLSLEREYK